MPDPSRRFHGLYIKIPRSPKVFDARQIDKRRASSALIDAHRMTWETRVKWVGRRASITFRDRGIWKPPPGTLTCETADDRRRDPMGCIFSMRRHDSGVPSQTVWLCLMRISRVPACHLQLGTDPIGNRPRGFLNHKEGIYEPHEGEF